MELKWKPTPHRTLLWATVLWQVLKKLFNVYCHLERLQRLIQNKGGNQANLTLLAERANTFPNKLELVWFLFIKKV